MTMNKLISSLVSNAEKEAEEIVKSAESDVDRLVAMERAKRAIFLKAAEEECERLLQDQKRERVAWARLEGRRILSEAKEDAIKGVLEEMHGMLSQLKKSADYATFMKNAVIQAADELGNGDDLVLHLTKGDRKFVTKFKGRVVEDLDSAGGLIVEKDDGMVRVDLTLESILENKKDDIRKRIYEKLFEA